MSEPKPFASLSPTLLARKGGARPAMRPQWQPYSTEVPLPPQGLDDEDLGWNDMGEATGESNLVPFGADQAPMTEAFSNGPPAVVRQQDALAQEIAEPAVEPSPLIPLAAHRLARAAAAGGSPRRSALAEGRRAAFTLRVDEARHLRLRLAATLQGRSAQQIVTDALDRLLESLPELEDLARRVKRR